MQRKCSLHCPDPKAARSKAQICPSPSPGGTEGCLESVRADLTCLSSWCCQFILFHIEFFLGITRDSPPHLLLHTSWRNPLPQLVFCADITWLPRFLPRERMSLFSRLPELPLSLLPWAETTADAFPCPELSLQDEEQGWQPWPCSVAVPWPPKARSVTDSQGDSASRACPGGTQLSVLDGSTNIFPEQGLGCLMVWPWKG